MPYYFDALQTPEDDSHLWERLREVWQVLHDDLTEVHFETEAEALAKTYPKSLDQDDIRVATWNVARYRETDDRDNLLYFHEMALEALGTTEWYIERKTLSAAFLTQWSMLLSCHGFVAAALMARGDDLQSRRAGQGAAQKLNIDAQRQWFAHYYLRERPRNATREDTEAAVWRLINAITDGSIPLPEAFPTEWFDAFLNLIEDGRKNLKFGRLTKAFGQTRLSEKQMRRLIELPSDHLPPLNLQIPPP